MVLDTNALISGLLWDGNEFTGIDAPYKEPQNPDILIKTDIESVDICVMKIINCLKEKQFITDTDKTIDASVFLPR